MKKTSAAKKKTSSTSATSKKSPRRGSGKTTRTLAKNSPRMGNAKAIVRTSPIHGRGVVARVALEPDVRIVEYRGERIDWPEALRRHPHDPEQPFHTFYFSVDDDHVIDGNAGGNFARFMNHSCEPNCEAETVETPNGVRVYIKALRDIPVGQELTYDYGLTLDERHTKTLKKQFACFCGSKKCKGTMLSSKR